MGKFKKPSIIEESPRQVKVGWNISPNVTLVLDGDEIAFKTAAACQETFLQYKNSETEAIGNFKNKTQFKKFMEGTSFNEEIFTSELVAVAEPLPNAINTMKSTINNLCSRFNCHPDNVEIYIGGEGNFRLDLPLPIKYKSSRSGERPVLLDDLKNYLLNYKGATLVEGMEADDALMIRMVEGYNSGKEIIAVTVDKDAMQGAGILYNPVRDVVYNLENNLGELWEESLKGTGFKWLLFQTILGDSTDTYNPRDIYEQLHGKKPKFGEKAAYNLIAETTSYKDCLSKVCNIYKEWYGDKEPVKFTAWDGSEQSMMWYEILNMYFLCAYMKRKEDDNTNMIDILKGFDLL